MSVPLKGDKAATLYKDTTSLVIDVNYPNGQFMKMGLEMIVLDS